MAAGRLTFGFCLLTRSLVGYGVGSINIGNPIAKTIGGVAESVPILGSVISILVDSTVQGLSNAILTAVIGRYTLAYLEKEYRLQSILDEVVITESDEEFAKECEEIKAGLAAKKNKKPAF